MRVLAIVTPLVAVLSLAACEQPPAVEAGTPAQEEPDAPASNTLADVDLDGNVRVTGTEPFWGIDIAGETIVFSGVDLPEQTGPRSPAVVQGTVATWTTTTDAGNEMTITVTATDCSDGMSDRTYPLTAQVNIGVEVFNGCAASTEWFETTGEDGEPL